jgi:alpha 1,2-mannosyltransferase
MIRWQSGLFYLHPALANYDYYWRVEPDVHFFCDILYDPFTFLAENGYVYGFNMAILDDARSFAGLWDTTRQFMTSRPDLIHPEADLSWLLNPNTGYTYNNCQFFSNFEIASLNFFRSNVGNRAYFEYLDKVGGFYYSRWGDAPVHTLSLAMFVPKERVWWFGDIGYQHDIARWYPPDSPFSAFSPPHTRHDEEGPSWPGGRCTCAPTTNINENFYKLVPMESPQRKPDDSCIRLWLGGDEWLGKKSGWDRDAERVLGGDGFGGYVREGL